MKKELVITTMKLGEFFRLEIFRPDKAMTRETYHREDIDEMVEYIRNLCKEYNGQTTLE